MENNHKKPLNLAWNSKWYHPFESPWGVFEKLMYANSATSRDLLEILGTDNVKNRDYKVYGNYIRDLIFLQGFDEKIVQSLLGINLINDNHQLMNKLIRQLLDNRQVLSRYINKNLRVCPVCIKKGFHSIFHQVSFISLCPFHNTSLLSECPNCSKSLLYQLSDKGKRSAFVCGCGFSYIGETNILQTFNSWVDPQATVIQCEKVNSWLQLNLDEINIISKLHMKEDLFDDHIHNVLDSILEVLNKPEKNNISSNRVHHNVHSPQMFKNIRTEYEDCVDPHWRYKLFADDVYTDSVKIFSSIARHLRKTLLKDHKTCIKRFVKRAIGPDICPYAYAYVLWKKAVVGYHYFQDVDNEPYINPRRIYPHDLDFITKFDVNYLREVFQGLFGNPDYNKPPENIVASKWVLFHTMSHLILNDFYGWLSVSESMIEQDILLSYQKFAHKYVPFYIIELPIKKGAVYKFHWWTEIEKSKKNLPKCPFGSKRSKRDYRYKSIVYIDHPLKAAMRNFSY